MEDIEIAISFGIASSKMTHLGQSREEIQKLTTLIVNLMLEARIGAWNVRTMFVTENTINTGKAGQET